MKSKRYKLFPKQTEGWRLLEDPAYRRYLFDGGARSGKTDLILVWLIKEALTRPGARILCARLKRDHAKTTLWGLSLKKILPPGCGGVRYQESILEARFPNGSMIRVGGLDDAERTDKVLGDEYLHIFINEATQLSWETITKAMTRLSQSLPGKESCLILDCNPKHSRHWLHQVGVQHIQPIVNADDKQRPLPDAEAWARMHWTPYDNPHLPRHTLATLEALPGVMRKRMLEGIWCSTEGLVYSDFDQDAHCFDDLSEISVHWKRYRSIDFGFTNPFCCLWGAVDGDGRLWIYREHYKSQTLIEDHAEIINRFHREEKKRYCEQTGEDGYFVRTVADHEEAEGREQLVRHGIDTEPAKKAVTAGIQAVQKRLMDAGDGRPRLFVHSSCHNLLNEFYSYRWADKRQERNQDERPVDANDHAMDALRYMVMEIDQPAFYAVAAPEFEPEPGSASDLARYF